MVSIIYKGNDPINFKCDGVGFKANVRKDDVIVDVPQDVYDRDLKGHQDFTVLTEKKDVNKMEKSTKGA